MRILGTTFFILLLLHSPVQARKPEASWKNRCEQCHGDHIEFARKYLWNVKGQLQGQHHIEDLDLFMKNHYTPRHELEAVNNMLLTHANSPERFTDECGNCHGDAAEFVEESIWVRGESMTAMQSGMEVSEFLPTHENIQPEDVTFYLKLFKRIAD